MLVANGYGFAFLIIGGGGALVASRALGWEEQGGATLCLVGVFLASVDAAFRRHQKLDWFDGEDGATVFWLPVWFWGAMFAVVGGLKAIVDLL